MVANHKNMPNTQQQDALAQQAEYNNLIESNPELKEIHDKHMARCLQAAQAIGMVATDGDIKIILHLAISRSIIDTLKIKLVE